MGQKAFSKKEAVTYGWKWFKAKAKFFILVMIIIMLLKYAPKVIANGLPQQASLISGIILFASWVASVIVDMGILRIALNIYDGAEVNLQTLFSEAATFFKFLVASVVYGLIVAVGLILLIVPGIFFGISLQFAPLLVIDKGIGPVAAIKESWRITKGARLQLLLFGLILVGINLLGVLLLLVGVLAAIPVTTIANVWVYRELTKQSATVSKVQTQKTAKT